MGAAPQPHSQARLSSTGRETNRQTRFTQSQPLKTTLTPFLCLLPPATDSFTAPWLHILDPLTSGFYSTDPLKWTQIQEAHSAVKTALVLELALTATMPALPTSSRQLRTLKAQPSPALMRSELPCFPHKTAELYYL